MTMEKTGDLLRHAGNSRVAGFFVRLVRQKVLGTIGAAIFLIVVLAAIFADFIAPYGMTEIHLFNTLEGPSTEFWLGTDEVGTDVFTGIVYGARVAIIIGFTATALHVVVAILVGLPSGYFGGKFDIVLQRFVDAWMAFPSLLLVITIMSMTGRGSLQLILVLGITGQWNNLAAHPPEYHGSYYRIIHDIDRLDNCIRSWTQLPRIWTST